MKTIIKALIFAGLAILRFIVAFPVGQFVFEIVSFDDGMEKQMKTGQKYMDSLTDKDIQVWIERTQKYLKDDPTTNTVYWDDDLFRRNWRS